ncbi:MAG: tagatose 1,6-diphosphate aldolase [Pseudomonadota bacterium]
MTEVSAGKYWGLRRLADDNGVFKIITVDQRPAIKDIIAEKRGVEEAPFDDVVSVKKALVETLADKGSASVVDPHYAYPTAFKSLSPRRGLLISLEDSVFAETPDGRLSKEIDDWSVEKIKRVGADGVKVLVWYRPDANANVLENQRAFIRRVGEACAKYDLPFVVKALVYSFPEATVDYFQHPDVATEHVMETVSEFAKPEYRIDLSILQSPIIPRLIPAPDSDDNAAVEACRQTFRDMADRAGRPWIISSGGSDPVSYRHILDYALDAGASGYLAGRATWWTMFSAFPNMPAMINALEDESAPYLAELAAAADARAKPWTTHDAFMPSGPELAGLKHQDFRGAYSEFEEDA